MSKSSAARQILAEAVNAGAETIPEDARIGTYERWDSLAHLRLLLTIEQKLGRALDADEVVRIESLADVAAILGEQS